jgi:hypothetical protein
MVRDTAVTPRWTDAEMYRAINHALLTWQGRVRVPHVYTLTSGWAAGTFEYVLPDFISSDAIQPQMRAENAYDLLRLSSENWVDIPGYVVEPNASNQRVLRFTISPYSTEGRIIWWGSNSLLPLTVPTLSGQSLAENNYIDLTNVVDCGDYGWALLDTHWIQYAGIERFTSKTVLKNVVRGLPQGTPNQTHLGATACKFGVAMPKLELYRVLLDQAIVHLHELYLGNASPKENQTHQEMIGFYTARVDKFWKNWNPPRVVRQVIDVTPFIM